MIASRLTSAPADVAPDPAASTPRFGPFAGVTRPVFLTILGAMLYLREGWLVGELGLAGAVAVILAAHLITGTTALSLASIASDVRVHPGGAFAIIAQALGLEAGGAIGVPLYLAQALSSAMYAYAFTEAWAWLSPTHDPRVVVAEAFSALALVAWRSAGLAFKAQAVMLVVVGLALTSAALGLLSAEVLHTPRLLGSPAGSTGPVEAFAIFFPAATGVMVGVGMSGDLQAPRRAIPRGTLAAWLASLLIDVGFAAWYALVASPDELLVDKTVMIERALYGPLVLAGLLSSTLMAALSSLVAAPRLLQAMAQHGVVPGARWLERTTATGEPRNAVVATTLLAGTGLAAGSLDAIAPVITRFFTMPYLAVNLVVHVEMLQQMSSFRPGLRVPRLVPLVGIGACLDQALPAAAERLRARGIEARWARLHTDRYMEGIGLTLDALRGELFPPDLVVVDATRVDDAEVAACLDHCRRQQVGLALWLPDPQGGVGPPGPVSIRVSDRSPDWRIELRVQNLDLPMLLGYLLSRAWGVQMQLLTVVSRREHEPAARAFLASLVDQARLPADARVHVSTGDLLEQLAQAPASRLHLFGMPLEVELARLRRIRDTAGAGCVFLLDSGRESVVACARTRPAHDPARCPPSSYLNAAPPTR